jgi:non-homologous end joining protein Ku
LNSAVVVGEVVLEAVYKDALVAGPQRSQSDAAKYHDTYTEDVKKLIEDKAKGQKRQAPPPKSTRSNVIDLVAALQESLAQKKPRKCGAA